MVYFISDLHFGHSNIIKMDNRPFNNVENMDKTMIENWNSRVTNKDVVYILGDFSWHKVEKTIEILKQLKGKKILIKGNHDKISQRIEVFFEEICDYKEVHIEGNLLILSHYPIMFYKKQYNGSYHFYGHVHVTKDYLLMKNFVKQSLEEGLIQRAYNVGAMLPYMDFTPRTFSEIVKVNNAFF